MAFGTLFMLLLRDKRINHIFEPRIDFDFIQIMMIFHLRVRKHEIC